MSRQVEATLDLPFRLRERDGSVHVELAPNHDPEDLGHPLVAIGYDVTKFTGFPDLVAAVAYDGYGARGWMGWVQVVARHDDDGTVVEEIDGPPFFPGSPLYTFGYLPTFSDFPANPDHPDGSWLADAFLVAIPDVVRTRRLAPVVGFRWGYRLLRGECVERFRPSAIGSDEWEGHRLVLERTCPDWVFLEYGAL